MILEKDQVLTDIDFRLVERTKVEGVVVFDEDGNERPGSIRVEVLQFRKKYGQSFRGWTDWQDVEKK